MQYLIPVSYELNSEVNIKVAKTVQIKLLATKKSTPVCCGSVGICREKQVWLVGENANTAMATLNSQKEVCKKNVLESK